VPHQKWRLKVEQLRACNCNLGRPCSFDSPPTYGNCETSLATAQRPFGNWRRVSRSRRTARVQTAGRDSDLDLLIVGPRAVHEELARDLFRIGARHDVTVSPYLVERTELDALDPQFLESLGRVYASPRQGRCRLERGGMRRPSHGGRKRSVRSRGEE